MILFSLFVSYVVEAIKDELFWMSLIMTRLSFEFSKLGLKRGAIY